MAILVARRSVREVDRVTATPLDRLQDRLGVRFADPALLRTALTHASAVGDDREASDNERLEFLGDRVLGLLAAETVYARDADAEEGRLARLLNAIVRKESCAKIAERMDLGDALIMARGEARSGGRAKKAILADACEAVLGAAYLDGGLEAARRIFERFWTPLFEEMTARVHDPKSALQEWLQAQGKPAPDYRVVARGGPDHRPTFTVEAVALGLAPIEAEASSKRAAEQAAARALLFREGVWSDDR